MKARFRVQHQILSGMKYVQVVKRMGISNKMQEMIGSYSPNTTDKPEYEKKCEFFLSFFLSFFSFSLFFFPSISPLIFL
jgi:predicted membrane-bound dolichyl-phosphate-mannose-protein mannosyltransferase